MRLKKEQDGARRVKKENSGKEEYQVKAQIQYLEAAIAQKDSAKLNRAIHSAKIV
jgi:hypothetical protein